MAELAMTRHRRMEDTPSGVRSTVEPSEAPPAPPASTSLERQRRLRRLVDGYFDFVARVLRNAGTPAAELDDEVQRTFITVARRLDDVRPGAERSFILHTALNVAAHARRAVARKREVLSEELPEVEDLGETPEELAGQKRARELLDTVLDALDPDLRTVFVLYEFEELRMVEIAEVLSIPQGTVASRLRRARAEFRERVRALEIEPKEARS